MKEESEFIKLVQDEAFIRLVLESADPEDEIDVLIQEHPEKRDAIIYAFEFIRLNHTDKTKMNPEDSMKILNALQDYSRRKSSSKIFLFFPQLRIAVMILVIIAIGSLVTYHRLSKDPLMEYAQMEVAKSNHSVIVLSDGTEQVLKNNNSLIDYSSKNKEIIVSKDSDQERIKNAAISNKAILNQIVVPFGQRQKVCLSDGTLVQLNAGSKLVFPALFSGKIREVYLKGEGFFEVHKDAKVPFIVKTDDIDVKVLGTKFNVSAYEDEPVTSTVLVEGKVNVTQKNKILGNKQFTLAPGQGCFYAVNEKNSTVRNVDVNEYILWKEGLYNFKNLPLSQVLQRVDRYYNLTILTEDNELGKTLISGKLVLSDNINEVMQFLSRTMESRYVKKNDSIYTIIKENLNPND